MDLLQASNFLVKWLSFLLHILQTLCPDFESRAGDRLSSRISYGLPCKYLKTCSGRLFTSLIIHNYPLTRLRTLCIDRVVK
jgi:hypothetical protein